MVNAFNLSTHWYAVGRGATKKPELGQVLINWRLLGMQGAFRGHSGLEQVKEPRTEFRRGMSG